MTTTTGRTFPTSSMTRTTTKTSRYRSFCHSYLDTRQQSWCILKDYQSTRKDTPHTKPLHQLYSSSSSSFDNEEETNNKKYWDVENNVNQKNDIVMKKVRHSFIYDILPIVLRPFIHETNDNMMMMMMIPPHQSSSIRDNNNNNNNKYNNNSITDITVLLGVSGGCDSMALFHLLYNLLILDKNNNKNVDDDDDIFRTKPHIHHGINSILHWNLIVVHFDHQQRGIESDQDRTMVEMLCQQCQIPCYTYYWNDLNVINDNDKIQNTNDITGNQIFTDTDTSQSPKNATTKERGFSQDIARKWRRRIMSEVVLKQIQQRKQQFSIDHDTTTDRSYIGMIMTAHHKDDSEETMLLKLLRGVHLTNIEGLATVQQCSSNSNDNSYSTNCESDDTNDTNSNIILEINTPTTTKNNGELPMMYYVRPLLSLRKNDLIQYLQQNNYTWREDGSNQSNKYLRNRIRNELIPLLHNMLQKEDSTTNILERRLENLQQQSADIRNDLNQRVQAYLNENVSGDGEVFYLPMTSKESRSTASNTQTYDIVMKEALYEWTKRRFIGRHQLSYEQIQRVYTQLIQYPQQRTWQLNIGNSYNIVRYGSTLRITCDDANNSATTLNVGLTNGTTRICATKMKDSNFNESNGQDQWIDIQIRLETKEIPYQFIQTTIGTYYQVASAVNSNDPNQSIAIVGPDVGTVPSLSFTPPWKKSSTSNSTICKSRRMNDFLRGQDIPLDERPNISIILGVIPDQTTTSPMIPINHTNHWSGSNSRNNADAISLLTTSKSSKVVAVYVPKKQKWIIDRQFWIPPVKDNDDHDVHGFTCTLYISVVDPLKT